MRKIWIFIGLPFALFFLFLLNNLFDAYRLSKITNPHYCDGAEKVTVWTERERLCSTPTVLPGTFWGIGVCFLVFLGLVKITKWKMKHDK